MAAGRFSAISWLPWIALLSLPFNSDKVVGQAEMRTAHKAVPGPSASDLKDCDAIVKGNSIGAICVVVLTCHGDHEGSQSHWKDDS
jgi:hypothetical protein